jgi:hypothetical protein
MYGGFAIMAKEMENVTNGNVKGKRSILALMNTVVAIFLLLELIGDVSSAFAGFTWTQRTAPGSRSWQSIASSSDGTKLAAAVDGGYIYTSTDSGVTWTERTAAGSHLWSSITSSSDGTKLAAVAHVYGYGYICTSTDSGATWTEHTVAGGNSWYSIASSSDGTKLAVGTAGGYSGYIYTSTDSGSTWIQRTAAGSRSWQSIASSSDGTGLAVVARDGYIYTSMDSGATWTEQTSAGSSSWQSIASSSDGTKFAVASGDYIYTSTDLGATWTRQIVADSSQYQSWCSIASSSDGTKLAAVAYHGYIYTSTDSGATWTKQIAAGSTMWRSIASSSDGTKLSAAKSYIWTGEPDVIAPTITSVTSTTSSGSYATSFGINITLKFNEPVSSTGLTISLNSGTSINTGTLNNVMSWSGTYTIAAGESTSALNISAITGTITDGSANSTVDPVIPAGKNLGDLKAIAILLSGLCGSSDGKNFTTAPTNNLCTTELATEVSGNGPWSWRCKGLNGGPDANCAAYIWNTEMVQLPQTGQTTCYDASGAVITCAGTMQDGDAQAGVPWPNPRFTDNGDQTVMDNLTGLIWAKNGNVMQTRDPGFDTDSTARDGRVTWQHALDYVKKLNQENYLGHNDWRLPNVIELESLINAGQASSIDWLNTHGFTNIKSDYYWTSNTHTYIPINAIWQMAMYSGYLVGGARTNDNYVLPVRSGQSALLGSSIISLPETGQTTCYDANGALIACAGTGQDGELQMGIAWPNPRFTDFGYQMVKDNLTGLIWTKDGKGPGPSACGPGTSKTWQGALDYVKCLNTNNYLGYNDWSLPNKNELGSLINVGQASAAWLNTQGFANVQGNPYWSSSNFGSMAFSIGMQYGGVSSVAKSNNFFVWPVRTGKSGSFASLTVSLPGSSTVTITPAGITCGNQCNAYFNPGTSITLTAQATSGSTFTGWTGGGCQGTGTCTVTLNSDTTVTATFMVNPVNGICGTPNGQTFTTAPTTNLCSTGSATSISGDGPWSWLCTGINGGTDANCATIWMRGDINKDKSVDISDTILTLQVMAGMNPHGIPSTYATSGTDVNSDNRIGLAEAIYALQNVSGLRRDISAAYSLADLAGTWDGYSLASGPGEPWWAKTTGTINTDGSFSFTQKESSGEQGVVSSVFSISQDGIITLPDVSSNLRCTMDSGKTIFVCTDTWDSHLPGTTELKVFLKKAAAYTLTDLAGVWGNNAISSGTVSPWWERGPLSISADGTFTGTLQEYPNNTDTLSGTLQISANGIITLVGRGEWCSMDLNKTVMACASTQSSGGSGTTELRIMTKKGSSFATADLAGTWTGNSLASGPGAPWWERAQGTIDTEGFFSFATTYSQESPDAVTGTFTISEDGIMTIAGLSSLRCTMDSGKRIFVCTDTWDSGSPGSTELKIFTKKKVN